ncbi:acetyl-CoA carboxylase carboxyl transferase subunit alpha, partial [bacterium]|nr:acetyl-CoA carboxylase carboxyl transferase subunit alpha [bacterium]
DKAMVGGLGKIGDQSYMFIGQQKGYNTKTRQYRNFGMANPEGYRKALRLMRMAARSGRPVVTFIDTPGAYPGIGAEERGQGEAIARNLREMAGMPIPIIVFVNGEGGSGGALALGVGDKVYMLENSIYSVISPEGCAAILWRDRAKASDAAKAMKITAEDALSLGAIDDILTEPVGGAHRNHAATAATIRETIIRDVAELSSTTTRDLLDKRLDKFLAMGIFDEE